MIDHFGRPDVARGIDHPGFQTLLEFGRNGDAVVKLSGRSAPPARAIRYRDVDPFVDGRDRGLRDRPLRLGLRLALRAHERARRLRPALACLAALAPRRGDRRKVLWDNPARLFGFRA